MAINPQIAELLEATGESARFQKKTLEVFTDLVNLIEKQNRDITALQAAREADPFSDANLTRIYRTDERMADEYKAIHELAQKLEDLEKAARENAKQYVTEALSDEDKANLKKTIDSTKVTIAEARKKVEGTAVLVNEWLDEEEANIPGGILSLLPNVESLLNTRGRKSASDGEKKGYATRVDHIDLDGKTAVKIRNKREGGTEEITNWASAIEALNILRNANHIEANAITAEELETAYYESKGVEFRDSAKMPETHTFKFEKALLVQKPNQEKPVEEPYSVQVTVVRNTGKKSDETSEVKTDEAPVADSTPAPIMSNAEKAAAKAKAAEKK